MVDVSANEMMIARDMAEALHSAYPGHLWAVDVHENQGVANVRNLMLSGQWGFVLKLSLTYSASDFRKRVIRAGGELLERYRVARGRADNAVLAGLPVDHAGRTIGDLTT